VVVIAKKELFRVKFFTTTISADAIFLFIYMKSLKMIALA
jgi:hypothetical protein